MWLKISREIIALLLNIICCSLPTAFVYCFLSLHPPTSYNNNVTNYIQDKKLRLTLNGNRKVVGQLRGYDAFLNVVLEDAVDEKADDKNIGTIVIRGNSIIQFESLDRLERTT